MFREIKRVKQVLETKECQRILEESKRGVLAINSEDGYPYALPLNHIYAKEENRLYFHSGKTGYKIECMEKDDKCSYCVIMEAGKNEDGWSLVYKSVIVFGRVGFVKDEATIEAIARRLSYKFTLDESYIDEEIRKSLRGTAMFYVEIEHMTGKRVNEK
ncbi:MAG: pyridoxamine 5'-phosphate oxidase family protein [Bacilli bacterium]|nr:pyridoxamine 5'-phosphate oxidase family protein [Bacilli bacterium]